MEQIGLCLEVAQGPQLVGYLVHGAGACQLLPGTVLGYGRATRCRIQLDFRQVGHTLTSLFPSS